MKTLVTGITHITGKKNNVEYVKVAGISENGDVVDILTTKEKFEKFGLADDVAMDAKQLAQLFSDFETVDFEFDAKGYLVGVRK